MSARSTASACAVLWLVAACASRPASSPPAEPAAAPSPAAAGPAGGPSVASAAPSSGGVTAVDLATVMRLAARNLDTRIIREAAREAEARVRQADERFLPTIRPGIRFENVDGRVQATEGAILDVEKSNAFAGAGVVLSWSLGEAVFQRLSARQRHRARCAEVGVVEARAALEAADRYLDLQRAQAAIEVARQAASLYERLAEQRRAQTELGGGFRGEVLAAQARRAHAEVALRRAEEAYDRAAARLREILDLPDDAHLVPVEATPLPLELVGADAPESAMIASALASRPEVRAARFQAVAAHEDWRGVTRGPLLPDVRAGYEGGGFGSDFGDLGGTERFGVGLEWKIGPGGLLDGPARDAAAARYQAAHLREERVRSEIVREVAEARAAVLSRAAAIRSAEHGVRDAAEAQTLFDERRREGVGGALEAVLAEETLTQARLDYLDGVIEHNKAQLRLMHALGVLR